MNESTVAIINKITQPKTQTTSYEPYSGFSLLVKKVDFNQYDRNALENTLQNFAALLSGYYHHEMRPDTPKKESNNIAISAGFFNSSVKNKTQTKNGNGKRTLPTGSDTSASKRQK